MISLGDQHLGDERDSGDPGQEQRGSESPIRPPISPITPPESHAQLDILQQSAKSSHVPKDQGYVTQTADIAFSDAQNTDAAALQAAISILQIQREKSKRDIESLQQLKRAAAEEPEKFTRDLIEGKLTYDNQKTDLLASTFEDEETTEDTAAAKDGNASDLPKIPTPQEVFRCPPINWAKYNVIGEPLDKMHETERLRPSGSSSGVQQSGNAKETVVAAPYSPLKDGPNQGQVRSRKP